VLVVLCLVILLNVFLVSGVDKLLWDTSTSDGNGTKGDWGSSGFTASVYDPANDVVFLAGASGQFGYYNKTINTTIDLRDADLDDWVGTTSLTALTYDSKRKVIFVAGNTGRFGLYNLSTNEMQNLSGVDLGDWMGIKSVQQLWYDSVNDIVYIVGNTGAFGYYNYSSNTSYSLVSTDLGDWVGTKNLVSLAYDSTHNLVFVSGQTGRFGYYNFTSNTTYDLNNTDLSDWIGTVQVDSLAYDSANDIVMLSGVTGRFGYYNFTANESYSLNGSDPGDWLGDDRVSDVYFDSIQNVTFLGGQFKNFGYYNFSTNITYYLNTSDPGDWIAGSSPSSFTLDNNTGLIYFAGGIEGYYNFTSNVSTDISTTDYDDWISIINVLDTVYANDVFYFVGNSGTFGYYNVTSNVTVDLGAKDHSNFVGITQIRTVTYVGKHDAIMLGGNAGFFAIYNITTDTMVDLSNSDGDDTWMTSRSINEMCYDSSSDLLYLGTDSELGYYNFTSNTTTNLTKINGFNSGDLDGAGVTHLACDSTNGLVYLGVDVAPPSFALYNSSSNSVQDLTTSDIGTWIDDVGDQVDATYLDTTIGLLYIGGSNIWGYYNTSENVTYDLRGTDTANWMGSSTSINDIFKIGDFIYFAGDSGPTIFGYYDPATNVTTNLSKSEFGDWLSTEGINSMAYDATRDLMFLTAQTGKYGVYGGGNITITNTSLDNYGGTAGTLFNITVAIRPSGAAIPSNGIAYIKYPSITNVTNVSLVYIGNNQLRGTWNSTAAQNKTHYIDIYVNDTNGKTWYKTDKALVTITTGDVSNSQSNNSVTLVVDQPLKLNFSQVNTILDIIASDTMNDTSVSVFDFSSNPTNGTVSSKTNARYIEVILPNTTNANLTSAFINVSYTDAEISGIQESTLTMYKWNETSYAWYELGQTGVSANGNYVWANVTSFSRFGLFGTATVAAATTTTTTTSSGGSSSSGISVSRISGGVAQKWSQLRANVVANMRVSRDGFSLTSLQFKVNKLLSGAELSVEKRDLGDNAPKQGKVYQSYEILPTVVTNADLEYVTMKFKVDKSWLSENSYEAEEMVMLRNADDVWVALETKKLDDDSSYVYYEASSPGLSLFAIVGRTNLEASASIPEEIEEVVGDAVEVVDEDVVDESYVSPPEPEKKGSSLLIVFLVLIIGFVGYLFFVKNKK
jgi:PGF-pre-PGF domain-containing protein